MIRRALGTTSMTVGAIAQGTGDYFWNSRLDDDAKVRLLRLGIDLGLTLIDTAEGYGAGHAETLVARATAEAGANVVVATKFSPEHHAAADVRAAAEGSLRRLRRDRLDLYQLHWPNPAVPLAETMEVLARLVEEGKVRAVGLSNVSVRELHQAQAALGATRVTSVQTEYNLQERSIEVSGLLADCETKGISVLAYSPLDQGQFGMLTADGHRVLGAVARRHGQTPTQVILRWIIDRPNVIAICRTTSEAHLRENAAATDFVLDPADVRAIDAAFACAMVRVPPARIRVAVDGEWGHPVYQTLEEALANRLGFVPSPADLAGALRAGDFLKPVRLVPARAGAGDYDYELVGGRIRYWAWVIAHGDTEPIPAYVRRTRNGAEDAA